MRTPTGACCILTANGRLNERSRKGAARLPVAINTGAMLKGATGFALTSTRLPVVLPALRRSAEEGGSLWTVANWPSDALLFFLTGFASVQSRS